MTTENATAVADAPKSKKAPKAKAKKVKQTPAAEQTIRERVFQTLAKTPMTGPALKDKLGLSGVPSLLKDEGVCDQPRIRRESVEGTRGVVYSLTARGKKDLANGKVDENAAPASGGSDWPEGK